MQRERGAADRDAWHGRSEDESENHNDEPLPHHVHPAAERRGIGARRSGTM
jgi:hypothetical protein